MNIVKSGQILCAFFVHFFFAFFVRLKILKEQRVNFFRKVTGGLYPLFFQKNFVATPHLHFPNKRSDNPASAISIRIAPLSTVTGQTEASPPFLLKLTKNHSRGKEGKRVVGWLVVDSWCWLRQRRPYHLIESHGGRGKGENGQMMA